MSEYMLMLNDTCNLRCPYCFAVENMHHSSGEISESAFDTAVHFGIEASETNGIGIIGGEPALHSRFDTLMIRLIRDDKGSSVDVFTNGTTLTSHISVFTYDKMHVLINCNSPKITGKAVFRQMVDGIDALFSAGIPLSRVGLGINIFEEAQDYSYFIDLVDRYHMDTIRVSVSVPTSGIAGQKGRFGFFRSYLRETREFVRAMFDRGVVPIFDCNKIPPCLLSDEEASLYERYHSDHDKWKAVLKSNYLNGLSRCTPSIVVDGNLNTVRCFPVSSQTRVSITDFDSLSDLKSYYQSTIDTEAFHPDEPICKKCVSSKKEECMGGCLIFSV